MSSNSNFNNGKRHIRTRTCYSGIPNQNKKIKFMTLNKESKEKKKYRIKYNFESIITMLLISAGWEGNETMKMFALFFAFAAGWSLWEDN